MPGSDSTGAGEAFPAPPGDERERELLRGRIQARLFGGPEHPVRIGRFLVLSMLGRGGMGVVYEARDERLDRTVAIKLIRDAERGPRERDRLLAEARAHARLSHPNVVQIHEVDEAGDDVFIVMELVRGVTLDRWLAAAPRSVPEVLAAFIAAGRGLAAAHDAGLVHRDVKPGNILVGDDGRVRIADFGLARPAPASPRAIDSTHSSQPDSTSSPTTASTGSRGGTPAYMSPEHLRGRPDARSDQFSFCVALHEALVGRRPDGDIGDARKIPRRLRPVLARGLSLAPDHRFATMADLLTALERPSRWRGWLAGAGGVLAIAGGLAFALMSPTPACRDDPGAFLGIWDTDAREIVRRAIRDAGGADGEATWGRLAAALDDYVQRWHATRRDICTATSAHDEQSRRALETSQRCLSRRRQDVAVLVDFLRSPDPRKAAASDAMTASLPNLGSCRDPVALARAETSAPGDDLREMLKRARLLQQSQRGPAALDLARHAVRVSQTNGDGPGEAEALLLLARLQANELRDFAAAITTLEHAVRRPEIVRHDALAWQLFAELALLYADALEDLPAAQSYFDQARNAHRRLDAGDPLAVAQLSEVESYVALLEDRLDRVELLCRDALARRQAHLPLGHSDLDRAHMLVARAVAFAGRPHEALELYTAMAAERTQRLGANHPSTAKAELNVALTYLELGDLGEARSRLQRTRGVIAGLYGERSPQIATIDLSLAQIAAELDELPEAEARARAALATFTAHFPPHYSERIAALVVLAELMRREERHAEALKFLRELLAVHDAAGITEHLPELLTGIGDALCSLDRCGEALSYYSRLDVHYNEKPPEDPALRAYPLQGIGRAQLALGNPALAQPFFEQALALLRASPTAPPEMTVQVARDLARCLRQLKIAPRRARELLALADSLDRDRGLVRR